MSLKLHSINAAGPAETLAALLACGPLPLGSILRCAHDIAAELRDLHQETRAYGKLTADSIMLTGTGAHLRPLRVVWDRATPERDIQAFGEVMFQMLTGTLPPATLTPADVRIPGARTGVARLRASSLKLALKCARSKGTRISMQQAATELRLLGVLCRQEEAHEREAAEIQTVIPPAATPFLVSMSVGATILNVRPSGAPSQETSDGPEAEPAAQTDREDPGEAPLAQTSPHGLAAFGQPRPKPGAKPQPAGGRCPKCDSAAVFESRARSPFEQTLERWKLPICRCHRCYHRYLVIARMKIGKDMPVGTERKLKPQQRHS